MNKLVWLDLAPWKDAAGWTIVHSFWQLTLIALILYLVLRFIPQKRAELRYTCLLMGLLAGLLWSGITFAQEWQSSETTPLPVVIAPLTIGQESVITPPAAPPTRSLLDQAWLVAQKLDAHTPAITVAWLIGMLIFSLYLLFGLGYLKYLEYHRTSLPSDHWQLRLDELSRQMGVKNPVQLYSSGAVNEPITFKLFQPVILVPVYFFTGLTPAQIESISVLKGPKAIEKYGQSGQFGVIEISTKQNAPDQAEEAKSGSERPANQGTIRIRAKTESSDTFITGIVTDENDQPIIGANVLIKGTRSGTISDFSGKFELRLPEDCVTLVFSYVGKATTELKDVCAREEKVMVQLNGSERSAAQENLSTRSMVNGRILTQDQTPLVGANIIIKGTTRGTVSDIQGNFRLELNQECPTLIVSYIGMKPKMLENLCEGKDLQIVLEQKPANAASPIVTPDTNPASILGELDELPKSLAFKVFPNPASELVNISFQLQEETKVKLSVYSLDGKLLQTLVDQTLGAGSQQFSWEAKELKGTFPILLEVPAGIVRQQVVIE